MAPRPIITSIEAIEFEYDLADMVNEPTIGIPIYKPRSTVRRCDGAAALSASTQTSA